ncbi:MAG TPA: DUF5666 domain-containing protein [Vicinamibacterales bacterium]|nr:DUF5666 domain-containing protein [Vicinamibacterales bacterium]
MAPLRGCSRLVLAAALALTLIACSDGGPPAGEPSSPASPTAQLAGATINGLVVNPVSPLDVTVANTAVSTRVGGDGRFALSRVPPGAVRLQFSGPSVNAMLALGTLQEGQVVSITVSVSGNSATLRDGVSGRDNDRNDDGVADSEILGNVAGLTGGCPNRFFTAAGQTVATTAATLFRRVTCELLVNGQQVEVEGPVIAGVIRAEKVQLENAQGVDRRGALAGLSGTCPSLSFSINGTRFFTNATTEFKDRSCSGLGNNQSTRADGHVQSDGRVLAERVRPE